MPGAHRHEHRAGLGQAVLVDLAQVEGAAGALRHRFAVQPGDRVALAMKRLSCRTRPSTQASSSPNTRAFSLNTSLNGAR